MGFVDCEWRKQNCVLGGNIHMGYDHVHSNSCNYNVGICGIPRSIFHWLMD